MIIGISGLAGSGKDTAADILVSQLGAVKISLADVMKRICQETFDFSEEQLWGPSEKRNESDKRYMRGYEGSQPIYLSPRVALQFLGTDWGRNCYENVWIDYTLRIADKLLTSNAQYSRTKGLWLDPESQPVKCVVIPDCRFRNEFNAIKATGGKLIRLKRAAAGLQGTEALHASETEQQSIRDTEFDYVVENNGTISELAAKLAELCIN